MEGRGTQLVHHTIPGPVHTKVNVPSTHVPTYVHTYKLFVPAKEDGEETTNVCTRTSVVQSCDCQLTQTCIQSAVSSTPLSHLWWTTEQIQAVNHTITVRQ